MPKTAKEIVKAAISTSTLAAGGILNPEQARKFLQMTFEATPLLGQIRHELRVTTTGELDKIGIGRRLLRQKTEDTDDGYRASVNHGKLQYATTAVRLPWEITEETLRQNIEGQNYENLVTSLMTRQTGVDTEDLLLNGDASCSTAAAFSSSTDYAAGDYCTYNDVLYKFTAAHAAGAWTGSDVIEVGDAADLDFLKLNDGFLKQLRSGHEVDKSANPTVTLDTFYEAIKAIPNKYNDGSLRWLMSPHRRQEWEKYILTQAVTQGGVITDRRVENPAAVPVIEVPSMPDTDIVLINPKNLIEVNSYNVVIRKTTEGKEAIMKDKRFYVIHFDFDAIIEEVDASAIITGLAQL